MSQRILHRITGVVTTTDGATVTSAATHSISGLADCTVSVLVYLHGSDASKNGVSMSFARQFSVVSGALTAQGAGLTNIMTPIGVAALLTAVPTLDASGTDIRVRILGVAATTIEWFADCYVTVH